VIVPLLLVATVLAVAILDNSFSLERGIVEAVRSNQRVVRLQLDEETGIRGFELTGRRTLLEPYNNAVGELRSSIDSLASQLAAIGVPHPGAYVDELRRQHAEWSRRYARVVLGNSPHSSGLEVTGKTLVDRFRAGSLSITNAIRKRSDGASISARNAILQLAAAIIAITIVSILLLVYSSGRQRRLLREIDAERGIIDVLQSALVNQLKPISGTRIGTSYISATDGIAVGGDFFDAQPLTKDMGYILVGDVSGKGVTAAVDSASCGMGSAPSSRSRATTANY
jgi:CHASE3 domain sensor protein